MNKNYEEEYSLLEIAKYNLKHWPILLVCVLIAGTFAGAYGYKNTEPSVVYYEQLSQVNGAFFIDQYSETSINERMYDAQQVALSHGAYEKFTDNTGYELTYEEYQNMFGYSNYIVTSVLNLYVAYPETYGAITVETEEEAIGLMQQLMDAQMDMYEEHMGRDAIKILSAPWVSSYTQASADTTTTPKDLLTATLKGALAGIFLGLLLGVMAVSAVYLVGTVAKQAKEIEQKLKAPALAFVHKKDRAEEFKKVNIYLERSMGEHESICYIPFHEKNADGGYDLARTFASMNKKTLYLNLSAETGEDGMSVSDYLFGKCKKEDVKVTATADGVDVINRNMHVEEQKELLSARGLKEYIAQLTEEYERVVVNAPELIAYSDAYGIAAYCDKIVFGCKRREVTGTDLYEINHALDNNSLALNGVVVYGN